MFRSTDAITGDTIAGDAAHRRVMGNYRGVGSRDDVARPRTRRSLSSKKIPRISTSSRKPRTRTLSFNWHLPLFSNSRGEKNCRSDLGDDQEAAEKKRQQDAERIRQEREKDRIAAEEKKLEEERRGKMLNGFIPIIMLCLQSNMDARGMLALGGILTCITKFIGTGRWALRARNRESMLFPSDHSEKQTKAGESQSTGGQSQREGSVDSRQEEWTEGTSLFRLPEGPRRGGR